LFFILVTSLLLLGLLERLAWQLSRAYQERIVARDRLAAVVESPLMGIAAWTAEGQVVEANDALLSMWGYSRAQFDSERPSILEMSPPEFHERDIECLRNAAATSSPGPYEKILQRRDGSQLPVITGVTTLPGTSSEGLLFVLDDTERRSARDQLNHLLADLEHRVDERTRELQISNEELESFGYSVSHDLRAPLRSIDGMAVLITQDGVPLAPEQLHAVERIRHNVNRMSMLVDALLQLARTTQAPVRMDTVDLTRVAELALADVRSAYPSRTVEVRVEEGLAAHGDASLLRVMLYNILDNAFKFTAHAVDPQIEVFAKGSSLVIRDNGAGFDPSIASGLFRPFHRLHSNQEFPGTGIGLAIVHRIVRRHGGSIQATAVPGHGAEFTISLPRLQSGTGNAP
jgi:PAS domain S-box-containing protein